MYISFCHLNKTHNVGGPSAVLHTQASSCKSCRQTKDHDLKCRPLAALIELSSLICKHRDTPRMERVRNRRKRGGWVGVVSHLKENIWTIVQHFQRLLFRSVVNRHEVVDCTVSQMPSFSSPPTSEIGLKMRRDHVWQHH